MVAMHLQGSPLKWYWWLLETNHWVPLYWEFEKKIASIYGDAL